MPAAPPYERCDSVRGACCRPISYGFPVCVRSAGYTEALSFAYHDASHHDMLRWRFCVASSARLFFIRLARNSDMG